MYTDGKLKVIDQANVQDIKELLLTFNELAWEADQRRHVNKNFSETHTLWLQQHSESHDSFLYTVDMLGSYNNQEFNSKWIPLCSKVENALSGKIVRALIIRTRPGKTINRHMDGLHNVFKYCHRIILPITSNSFPFLFYDDESFILDEGTMYDSNGFVPHWAVNNGTDDVYTAIFDVLPDQETSVAIKELPNIPETWKWLKEHAIRKVHNNSIMPAWEQWLEEERQRKLR